MCTIVHHVSSTARYSDIPAYSRLCPRELLPLGSQLIHDLVPISSITVVPPLAGKGASGAPAFHDLTGGEYKTQEHIHRDVADSRLLAIPTSRRRVAAYDPN